MPILKMKNNSVLRHANFSISKDKGRLTPSGYGYEILPSGIATVVSGKDAGELEGLELPAQRNIQLLFGYITPLKYNGMMDINPLIYSKAEVSFQRIFEPGEKADLRLFIRTKEKLDLNELEWIARFYLLD